MRISTYLSALVLAEHLKAELIDSSEGWCLAEGNDHLSIRYRWLDRISQTAQRRLLAVSKAQEERIVRLERRCQVAAERLNQGFTLRAYWLLMNATEDGSFI